MNNKFIINLILLIIFLLLFTFKTYGYQIEIAEKYNKIFSTPYLSESDITNYRFAYDFQDKCKWKSADKYILKIKNKILMGHILAQRYLHPNCYRSKYLELYYWLKKYNDHPQAKRIYRLAIKRMPQGYKSPTKPSLPIGIVSDKIELKSKSQSRYKSKKKII